MFVGCGVEHVVGTMMTEDCLHTSGICDAGDYSVARYVGIILRHIQSYIVHGCLGLVNKDKTLGIVYRNLLDHFATDTSCSSRDENSVRSQQFADCIHIHIDFVSWKQILDVNLTQLLVMKLRLSIPCLRLRHHHNLYACL